MNKCLMLNDYNNGRCSLSKSLMMSRAKSLSRGWSRSHNRGRRKSFIKSWSGTKNNRVIRKGSLCQSRNRLFF